MKTIVYEPTIKEAAHRVARDWITCSLFTNADAADAIEAQWFRNPFHDFTFYWLGLVGLALRVTGRDPTGPFWHDAKGNEMGWNYGWTVPMNGWLPRPFLSYAGKWVAWYIGWRFPSGPFGLKLRRNSRG